MDTTSIVLAAAAGIVGMIVGGAAVGRVATARTRRLRERDRVAAEARLREIEALHHDRAGDFKAYAGDALRDAAASMLELAEQRLATAQAQATGALDARREAVEALVRPIGESLDRVDERLRAIELTRQDASSSLVAQVRSLHEGNELLRAETGRLVTALRSPAARGRWGELQLRRVVEMAGMLRHCDFSGQHHLRSEDGVLRPDMVVRLPGQRTIIVDAKAPLEQYLDATAATDDLARRIALTAHARLVRTHVDQLASKAYWNALPDAVDFVVLFLPGNDLLAGALEADAGLMEHAVANRVLLTTPVTLIALLRSVAYGWQQQALADNALAIAGLGREMQERLARFAEHLSRVGRGLDAAVEAYNASVGSFEHRVLVTGRRFQTLQVDGCELPPVATVDRRARAVAVEGRDESDPTRQLPPDTARAAS